MKNLITCPARYPVLLVFFLLFARPALPAADAGAVAFVADGHTYLGQYSLSDDAVSVAIDGLMYRGHYTAQADDAGAAAPGTAKTGQWGHAFLFASSAKVLQCQLKTGFPQVSGRCQAADGRQFELKPAIRP